MPAQFATGTAPVVTVAANFGADGPAAGGGIAYSLFTTNDTDSGLTTTAGQAIHLFNESYDGVHFVVGRYDSDGVNGITSADNAAFAFTVDPTTGALSLVQYVSLHHPNTSSNDEGIFLNTGSLSVKVTITDRDDDTATQSADISANIRFDDDGPQAVLAIAPKSGLTIDETAGQDAGTDDVLNIASFAALFNGIPAARHADRDRAQPDRRGIGRRFRLWRRRAGCGSGIRAEHFGPTESIQGLMRPTAEVCSCSGKAT